jgi:hypothetical protein
MNDFDKLPEQVDLEETGSPIEALEGIREEVEAAEGRVDRKVDLAAEVVETAADSKRQSLLGDIRENQTPTIMDRLSDLYDRVRGKESSSAAAFESSGKGPDKKKSLLGKVLTTVFGGVAAVMGKTSAFLDKYTPKWLKKIFKNGGNKARQAVASFPETIDVSLAGKGILDNIDKFGKELASNLREGRQHCWGWVEAVYEKSGFSLGASPMIYNAPGYETGAIGQLNFDMLEPGDHVIFHNGNSEDKAGNHSGIFVAWADREKGIAKVVSYSGGKDGVVREKPVNFNEQEIKRIRRPLVSSKKERFATYERAYEGHEMMDASAPVFTFPKGTVARVSSGVGYRDLDKDGKFTPHPAVDIGAAEGTPIIAMQDGCKVLISRSSSTAGNYVYLKMPDGKISAYLHLKELGPAVGTIINRGDVIGLVGNTGNSGGSHLHFEMQDGSRKWPNNRIDPNKHLQEGFREPELAKRAIQESNSGQPLDLA